MKKRAKINRGAKSAEGVPVSMSNGSPIGELDAELVRRLGVSNEVGLIDFQKAQQVKD
jgi:hypothetical protein